MFVLALIVLSPILYMVINSFKSDAQLTLNPVSFPTQLYFDNYINVFSKTHIITKFLNTVLVTSLSLIGLILTGSMAGYILGRSGRKWSNAVYVYFLTGAMVPFFASLVPIYRLVHQLGLMDNRFVLVILPVGGGLPFVIMLYTGFVKTVPKEIEESAYIDGSGFINTYFKIVFPLLLPATVAVLITNVIGFWNDFLTPLLFISTESKQTLALGVYAFMSEKLTNYASIYAYTTITILPLIIMFLFLQKYFYKGLVMGSLKS